MSTTELINKFYEDVQALGLRYPVAEISRKTGEPKGNVSRYLNRKIVPSEQFITKFYNSYKNIPVKKSGGEQQEGILLQGAHDATLQEYINLLRENDRFFKEEFSKITASLANLYRVGKTVESLVKLNLEHTGTVEARQIGTDPKVVHGQINIEIAEMPESEMGIDEHK